MLIVFSCNGNDEKRKSAIAIYQGSGLIENQSGVYDFGSFDVCTASSEITFIIKNEGNGKLLLTGSPKIKIIGNDATSFIVDDSKTSSSLAPNISTTFTVKFIVSSLGSKTAIMNIANNDEINGSFAFTIVGKGAPIYKWTKVIGSEYDKNVNVTKTDSLGNVFVAGMYRTSVDFGADFGVTDVKNCTKTAMFITKIMADGSYGWTRQFYGGTAQDINCIAFDSKENVYLIGNYCGIIDFGVDFGTHDILATGGSTDIFITKIQSNGDYGWTKTLGSTYTDSGTAITFDADDNLYFASTFYFSVDFGAPFGANDIKTANTSNGSAITKIDSDGNYVWTKQFGDYGLVDIYYLTVDNLSNIYFAGRSYGIVNFAEAFGTTDIKGINNQYGFFVSKITSECTYGWTKIVYSSNIVMARTIVVDSSQNVYLSGYFQDTVNFGEDFGITDTRTATPNTSHPDKSIDVFVMKINSDTSYGWVRQFGADQEEYYCATVVDSYDDVYFAARFRGTMNFGMDFGISDVNKEINTTTKTFLTKIKSDGSYCWTKCLEHNNFLISFSTSSISTMNDIFLTGSINDTFDFGKLFNSSDVKTANGTNNYIYVMKLQG